MYVNWYVVGSKGMAVVLGLLGVGLKFQRDQRIPWNKVTKAYFETKS